MMTPLGTLTRVSLRDVWLTEDRHFTPWLADENNIAILGDALGLELEVEAQERSVGPFRADILCKDLDDNWVLIENQLERTDHTHLGQLITYAAGLKAVTIVWISERFTEEHRAALDWLNQITDDSFRFFGVEVELWRIGDSIAAPKFNLTSKPNEWSKSVGQASKRIDDEAITATKRLQLSFWQQLQSRLAGHPTLRTQDPRPHPLTRLPIGRSGMGLRGLMHTRENWFAVDLYLNDEDATAHFRLLKQAQQVIESEIACPLEWLEPPGNQTRRIVTYLRDAPIDEEDRWDEYLDWMVRQLGAFDQVFRKRVRVLDASTFTHNEEQVTR